MAFLHDGAERTVDRRATTTALRSELSRKVGQFQEIAIGVV